MFSIGVDVTYRGPLFDGRAQAAIATGLSDAVWEIAKEARGALGVQFIRVFKQPTGAYEGTVEAKRISRDLAVVTDSGRKPYNHWLEGTGSRNFPVTRFKGYRSFEIVTGQMQQRASRIANERIAHALAAVGS